jgi:hypothetical protein
VAASRPEKDPELRFPPLTNFHWRLILPEGKTMRKPILAALLTLAAQPACAFYDTGDNVAELTPGSLQVAKTADLTLVEEKLNIAPHKIHVDYLFRNKSSEPVTTMVVFQLPDVEGPYTNIDAGDTTKDNFLAYAVSQDGAPVKAVLQRRIYSADVEMTNRLITAKIPLNPLSDAAKTAVAALPQATIDEWSALGLIVEDASQQSPDGKKVFVPAWVMKSAYYWTATFPAGKDVRITNSHDNSLGSSLGFSLHEDAPADDLARKALQDKYCVDDAFMKAAAAIRESGSTFNASWASYRVRVGSAMSPEIGKFTLTVEKSDPNSLVSFCSNDIKQIGPTTSQSTSTGYTPERDVDVLYLDRAEAP